LAAVPPDAQLTGDALAIPSPAPSTTIPQPNLSLRPDTSASTLATIVAAVPDSSLVKNLIALDEKRATLEKRISDLAQFYKPMHPAMMAAQQELDEVNRKINFNMQFARELQRSHIASLQAQVTQAEAALKQAEAEGLERNRALVMSSALQDDIERIRSLHNALLNQLMKIDVSQGFSANNVSILEPALVEAEPVYPKKLKGLMVAAAFGLGVGLALAFFIEYIDDSIKLAEEVERDLQLPFLGMVPAAQWNPDDLAAHRLDRLKQQGGVAEAYRVVRSAIIVSMPREKLRTILVTSAVPREGKTTTTLNLAIGFSQIEDRVLLVDGDLRRGETHKYFNLPKEKGFADILLGEATADEVVKQTDVPKLDVITCGSYPANPAELLLGWRLKEFLDWAKQRYSRVFIDCAPVMGIADGAILGSAVDGVLFIIWAGRTSRRYVRVAKTTASSRGAKIFGFMLNNLEPGRVGYYHYYPYYYSYYSRGYYYASKDEDAGKGGDVKGIPIPSSKDDKKADMDDVY
jgi:capsular exopolysaccharide synthesis family protein